MKSCYSKYTLQTQCKHIQDALLAESAESAISKSDVLILIHVWYITRQLKYLRYTVYVDINLELWRNGTHHEAAKYFKMKLNVRVQQYLRQNCSSGGTQNIATIIPYFF